MLFLKRYPGVEKPFFLSRGSLNKTICSNKNTLLSFILDRSPPSWSDTIKVSWSSNLPCATILPWRESKREGTEELGRTGRLGFCMTFKFRMPLTSKPWRRPTFIMSLQRLGTTHITSTAFYGTMKEKRAIYDKAYMVLVHHCIGLPQALLYPSQSSWTFLKDPVGEFKPFQSPAFQFTQMLFIVLHDSLTFRSNWYFIIRCTGLISRSVICSLWPKRCFRSWKNIEYYVILCQLYSGITNLRVFGKQNWPQSKCRCTLKRCAQTWVCSGSTRCTCAASAPGVRSKREQGIK